MYRVIARDLLQSPPSDVFAGPLHSSSEQAEDEFIIQHKLLSYCYWILLERVERASRSVVKLQEARERVMKV